jgi:hypothetical protein
VLQLSHGSKVGFSANVSPESLKSAIAKGDAMRDTTVLRFTGPVIMEVKSLGQGMYEVSVSTKDGIETIDTVDYAGVDEIERNIIKQGHRYDPMIGR